jgi:His-Xaa-Ser system protein HxsD
MNRMPPMRRMLPMPVTCLVLDLIAQKTLVRDKLCPRESFFRRKFTALKRSRKPPTGFPTIIPSSGEIECVLHFLPEQMEAEQAKRIVAAFRNEVLDQDLRSVIAKETEAIRNAVLAYALSKTGLQGGE